MKDGVDFSTTVGLHNLACGAGEAQDGGRSNGVEEDRSCSLLGKGLVAQNRWVEWLWGGSAKLFLFSFYYYYYYFWFYFGAQFVC